jgi:hypothetical protein
MRQKKGIGELMYRKRRMNMSKKRRCGGSCTENIKIEGENVLGKEEENCKENKWMRRIVINKYKLRHG